MMTQDEIDDLPVTSMPRVLGELVLSSVASGLLRLVRTVEKCPCGGDTHDRSLEERLHTAWWQGYYTREDEVREGRL